MTERSQELHIQETVHNESGVPIGTIEYPMSCKSAREYAQIRLMPFVERRRRKWIPDKHGADLWISVGDGKVRVARIEKLYPDKCCKRWLLENVMTHGTVILEGKDDQPPSGAAEWALFGDGARDE